MLFEDISNLFQLEGIAVTLTFGICRRYL